MISDGEGWRSVAIAALWGGLALGGAVTVPVYLAALALTVLIDSVEMA